MHNRTKEESHKKDGGDNPTSDQIDPRRHDLTISTLKQKLVKPHDYLQNSKT
jgi:hypothetical protein